MTLKEALEIDGNVCKVKAGSRYKYYAYYDLLSMHSDGSLPVFEVLKNGDLKRRKKGLIYDTVINIKDIIEILPIKVVPWYNQGLIIKKEDNKKVA